MRGTSTRDALEGAITAITAAGCETPRLDAELLLADALGVSRERLIVDSDLVVEGPAVRVFQNAVRRRAVRARAGRLHPRAQGLSPDRAGRRPARADPASGDRAARRSRARPAARGAGARRGHGQRRRRARSEGRAPGPALTGSDLSEDALALARANGERLGLEVDVAARRSARGRARRVRRDPLQPALRRRVRARLAGSRDPPPRASRGAVRGSGRAGRDPRAARPGGRARAGADGGAGGRRRTGAAP